MPWATLPSGACEYLTLTGVIQAYPSMLTMSIWNIAETVPPKQKCIFQANNNTNFKQRNTSDATENRAKACFICPSWWRLFIPPIRECFYLYLYMYLWWYLYLWRYSFLSILKLKIHCPIWECKKSHTSQFWQLSEPFFDQSKWSFWEQKLLCTLLVLVTILHKLSSSQIFLISYFSLSVPNILTDPVHTDTSWLSFPWHTLKPNLNHFAIHSYRIGALSQKSFISFNFPMHACRYNLNFTLVYLYLYICVYLLRTILFNFLI